MDSAWEDWIRPLLIIALAGLAGLAWYLEWVPDVVVGVALAAALALAAAGAVAYRMWERCRSPRLRYLAGALIAGSVALAAWSPTLLVGPGATRFEAELTREAPTADLPALGSGADDYRLYLHGAPYTGKGEARVSLALWGAPGDPHIAKRGKLRKVTTGGGAGQKSRTVESHDLTWLISVDLSSGGRVEVEELSDKTLRWPVKVSLGRAPAPSAIAGGLGGLLLVLALLVETRVTKGLRTWLSTLAASAPGFTILFGLWYSPGHLTETVFGAALVALVIGTVISYPLLAIARRVLGGTRPDPAPEVD
ncbi:MAG: hypothetical protein CSA66_01215 [Proteobacteria bacterium]|nr:MAG: hypothetical protein CSA66_01215 [Pseudomonadota bacterium]